MDLYDVNDLKVKIDTAFNQKITSAVLHGKIKNNEKEAIMNDFKEGKISILIATTVIEVGIDVKNATMMVIFNAERFGLATLHQLRGRVGRSDLQSFCYLICNSDIPRLKVLEESNDGFYISEKDFELRGSGDLFGVKQSGDMVFKMADLTRDFKILLQTKEDAENFINNKEYLINPLYKELLEKLNFID
jgi:ATP-dependent DNA helicase RecG